MKNYKFGKILILAAICLLSACTVCGCGNAQRTGRIKDNMKKKNVSHLNGKEKSSAKDEKNDRDEVSDTGEADLYLKFLKGEHPCDAFETYSLQVSNDSGEVKYMIEDFNDDGIDDLITQVGYCPSWVYTVSDGEVTEVGTPNVIAAPTPVYVTKNMEFVNVDETHAGREDYGISVLTKDGEIKPLMTLSHFFPEEGSEETEESYYIYYEKTRAGEYVSKEEFDEKKDGYMKNRNQKWEEITVDSGMISGSVDHGVTNDDVHAMYRDLIEGRVSSSARDELLLSVDDWDSPGYAFFDMNGDGLDEMLVCVYGPFSVFTYKDGEIRFAGNTIGYSSGSPSFLMTTGEVLSVDTAHAGREIYQVFELTPDGELFLKKTLVREFPDPAYTVPDESFSAYEGPNEEGGTITKEEFDTLKNMYLSARSSVSFAPLSIAE